MDKIKAVETRWSPIGLCGWRDQESLRKKINLFSVFGHMLALHYCLWWWSAHLEYVNIFLKIKNCV